MKGVALLLLAVFGAASAEWALVWEDNFDGGDLKERWNFELGCNGWGNNELQCYTDNRPENARQENGVLIIEAVHENWEHLEFTSSRMTSKANWVHGLIEMRARLPKGKHLWPAFWMMPADSEYGGWPASGEIDIMEYRGQRPTETLGTLHFGPDPGQHQYIGSGEISFPFDFSEDWHTFKIDWSPDQIIWFVDDQEFHRETLRRNFFPGFYQQDGQPFDKNFFIIINLAVGGNFFGDEPFDPSESEFWEKKTYEIDYIRKYEWRQ